MRNRRFALIMLLVVVALPLASARLVAAQNQAKTIMILHTSDLHANLQPWDYYANKDAQWGLAKVATLVKGERAANPNTILLDSGDTIQGTPLGYYYAQVDQETPHPMATTMNALQYDAVALGNHEFNYGRETLDRWINEANFPVLSANIRNEDGSEAFQPYFIKDVDGVQVGILGMTTPAIPNWEKPENIEGLRFDDPIATAQQYVPQMRAEGADVIVVSQHIGWERAPGERTPEAWLTDTSTWQDTGGLEGENYSGPQH